MSNYLGIGKVEIDEAFLSQVAASRLRLQAESAGPDAPRVGHPTPRPGEISDRAREEARELIRSYFLLSDGEE